MLATDLRNIELVLGKLVSRLASLAFLILAGLPICFVAMTLGGIDPGLMLVGFAITLVTMISLAGVGILCSVYARRLSTAIVLTYLIPIIYIGVSLSGLALNEILADRDVIALLAMWGIELKPVRDLLERFNDVFGAGNIIVLLIDLSQGLMAGMPCNVMLPGLLRGYATFHVAVAMLCATWAVVRVRAVSKAFTFHLVAYCRTW